MATNRLAPQRAQVERRILGSPSGPPYPIPLPHPTPIPSPEPTRLPRGSSLPSVRQSASHTLFTTAAQSGCFLQAHGAQAPRECEVGAGHAPAADSAAARGTGRAGPDECRRHHVHWNSQAAHRQLASARTSSWRAPDGGHLAILCRIVYILSDEHNLGSPNADAQSLVELPTARGWRGWEGQGQGVHASTRVERGVQAARGCSRLVLCAHGMAAAKHSHKPTHSTAAAWLPAHTTCPLPDQQPSPPPTHLAPRRPTHLAPQAACQDDEQRALIAVVPANAQAQVGRGSDGSGGEWAEAVRRSRGDASARQRAQHPQQVHAAPAVHQRLVVLRLRRHGPAVGGRRPADSRGPARSGQQSAVGKQRSADSSSSGQQAAGGRRRHPVLTLAQLSINPGLAVARTVARCPWATRHAPAPGARAVTCLRCCSTQ